MWPRGRRARQGTAGRGLTSVLQRAREPHGDGAGQRLAGAVDDAAVAQADLEELHLPHGRAGPAALLRSARTCGPRCACPGGRDRPAPAPPRPCRAEGAGRARGGRAGPGAAGASLRAEGKGQLCGQAEGKERAVGLGCEGRGS